MHFTSAPKTQKLVLPKTEDSLVFWLKTSPSEGSYLAISNAPYIVRQDLAIKSVLPSSYKIDTVGPQAKPHERMAILLDELARALYQLSLKN